MLRGLEVRPCPEAELRALRQERDAAGAAAGRAGHRASPGAELDHFSSAARANSPRRCPDIAWGLALPSSGSHLHPARSCASKPALTRAPQHQGLVWEEGAGSETPCPKRRIWLASVHPAWLRGFPPWLGRSAAKPSATAQPPHAGPPWGHATTIPEARCGLYNGYHGDPVPGDARPTSDHRPAPARSPSQFVSPTLPHAVQATFPKGEVTSKLPCHGTATPCLPPSLPPPAVLTDTPKQAGSGSVRAPRAPASACTRTPQQRCDQGRPTRN